MKTPHLLASFAIAVTASAAASKDPAEVARTWDEKASLAFLPHSLNLSLQAQSAHPTPYAALPWSTDCWSFKPREPDPREKFKLRRHGDVLEVPPSPNLDMGFSKIIPDADKIPPGAKPWDYRGQTFWLVPIASDGGK